MMRRLCALSMECTTSASQWNVPGNSNAEIENANLTDVVVVGETAHLPQNVVSQATPHTGRRDVEVQSGEYDDSGVMGFLLSVQLSSSLC